MTKKWPGDQSSHRSHSRSSGDVVRQSGQTFHHFSLRSQALAIWMVKHEVWFPRKDIFGTLQLGSPLQAAGWVPKPTFWRIPALLIANDSGWTIHAYCQFLGRDEIRSNPNTTGAVCHTQAEMAALSLTQDLKGWQMRTVDSTFPMAEGILIHFECFDIFIYFRDSAEVSSSKFLF